MYYHEFAQFPVSPLHSHNLSAAGAILVGSGDLLHTQSYKESSFQETQ